LVGRQKEDGELRIGNLVPSDLSIRVSPKGTI
jgi:hypothetical protein